jgi:hypothetical protein
MTEYNDPVNHIRVRIGDNFLSDGIDVFLLREGGPGQRQLMKINSEHGWAEWEEVTPETRTGSTFTIQGEFGRALLEALLRHYQGASDMHTVRADLLHERARRDRLEDQVMSALGLVLSRPLGWPTVERGAQ